MEPESLWGRVGSGESPLTGGGAPIPTLPGDYPAYYAAVATALRDGGPNPVTAAGGGRRPATSWRRPAARPARA